MSPIKKIAVPIAVLLLTGVLACGTDDLTSPVNHFPVITGLHDTSATIGDTLFMTFGVSDPDGDGLSYAFGVKRTRDEIETAYWPRYGVFWDDFVFWYLPATRDGPRRTFFFRAEEYRGLKASKSFAVEILPAVTP